MPPKEPHGAGTERLRPCQRLKENADFKRVFAARVAQHRSHFVLFFRANGRTYSRIGVSVGRKHGNAVRRNRIKRVFREAFRRACRILPPGYDYVLVPRKGVREYHTEAVLRELEGAAIKIPRVGRAGAAHAKP